MVRVAKQSRRGVSPELGRFGRIRVGNLELGVVVADLHHLAHGLVADDVAFLHFRDDAVKDVQIRAADGAGGDLDDGVTWILDFGIRNRLVAHIALAVP